MCRQCWYLVPADLRAAVWRVWRQLNNAVAKGMDPRAIATLKREHAESKAAAIEFAKKRVQQPELFA